MVVVGVQDYREYTILTDIGGKVFLMDLCGKVFPTDLGGNLFPRRPWWEYTGSKEYFY